MKQLHAMVCVGLACAGLMGCAPEEQVVQVKEVSAREVLTTPVTCQEVVATVNGAPICAEVLRALVQRPGNTRSRDQLLQDLILGELGQEQALGRGYAETPEIRDLHRRLMTRRWMEAEVDRPAAPETIPDQDVKAYYDQHYYYYKDPELRDADHLLVQPDPQKWKAPGSAPKEIQDKARQFAVTLREDILARKEVIKDHRDLRRVKDRWAPQTPEGLVLLVENLPPAPREAFGEPGQQGYIPGLVEEFSAELFRLEPGQLSEPVTTIFGTHLMVLQRVLPPSAVPLEEAEPGIRDFLSQQRRQERFVAVRKNLNQGTRLLVNDQLWQEQIKKDRAPGKAPTQ